VRNLEVNIDKLVREITDKIQKRTNNSFPTGKKGKSILVIIPNLIFGFDDYIDFIKSRFKDFNVLFTSKEEILESLDINPDNQVPFDLSSSTFLTSLDSYEKVMLRGPKLDLLKSISTLNDETDINHIIIGRVMSSKDVVILINVNSVLGSKISKLLTDVRKVGIEVINIQDKGLNSISDKNIITEKDVLQFKDSDIKAVTIAKNQILTPLAKDKLREYKIEIEYSEED
jgi:hypothetical protein